MSNNDAENRVIGIRHALKVLKDVGLVEDETMYPDDAVKDIQEGALSVAERWYKIGAKRGALEILNAFIDGRFAAVKKNGELELTSVIDAIEWKSALNVRVGKEKKRVDKKLYSLTIEDLGFDK